MNDFLSDGSAARTDHRAIKDYSGRFKSSIRNAVRYLEGHSGPRCAATAVSDFRCVTRDTQSIRYGTCYWVRLC